MRSVLARKLDAAVRFVLMHGAGRLRGDVVINEYPKSGGSWIGQMLADLLGLPFPTNRYPTLTRCLLHGHHLSPFGMPRVVVVWRDGRDILVSWYFHCLFRNERENAPLVDLVRRDLPFRDHGDIRANLPMFIEYAFTRQRDPGFTWSDFVNRWIRQDAVHARYEDMRQRAGEELVRVVRELAGSEVSPGRASEVADRYSFARQSGRRPGEGNPSSFMRKGIVGDWRNQFTQDAREVFAHFAGDALVLAGYEPDDSWVGQSETPTPSGLEDALRVSDCDC